MQYKLKESHAQRKTACVAAMAMVVMWQHLQRKQMPMLMQKAQANDATSSSSWLFLKRTLSVASVANEQHVRQRTTQSIQQSIVSSTKHVFIACAG